MAVATVVLLLACGIIVIQASPFDANANPNVNILKYRRNINANTNTNIIGRRNINGNANTNILSRRDINANANTNIIGRRNGIATVEDDSLAGFEEGEILPAEKMRRRGDTTLPKIAVAAGDAAYEVLREYSSEMNVNAANAVVETVLNILRRPHTVPVRRNYNSNSNTNIVGGRGGGLGGAFGGGALGGGAYGIASGGDAPLYPSHPSGLALAQGSGGHALGLSSGPGGYALAHGGRYADEEEVEAEDADNAHDGDHPLRDAEEEDEEEDAAAARRGYWGYPVWGGNNNANANTNVLNGWRRNHRRNVNANTNMNIIGHRRAQG